MSKATIIKFFNYEQIIHKPSIKTVSKRLCKTINQSGELSHHGMGIQPKALQYAI